MKRYEKTLEEAEAALGDRDWEDVDPEDLLACQQCEGALGDKLDALVRKLGKLDARNRAQKKLLALSKKVGECQPYLGNPQAVSPFGAAGGKKAGSGTVESRREQRDELADNGQNTAIKGIKGDGPSLSKIEAADDGSGTSNRRSEAREREVRRQFESFVQREDVPEDVKQGVKEYFNRIQQAPDAE